MTRIGVKTRKTGHLHVLVIYSPGSRRRVAARYTSRRPWLVPAAGDAVLVRGAPLLVIDVQSDDRHVGVYTANAASNVVAMPLGPRSVVADFLRYHVLVRVFDGDAAAWLAHLETRGADAGDVRFARWLRTRLRADPTLLAAIRRMVDATPLWVGVGA